ncbi:hypothetical protein [Rathayibacter toxicus]|uniref:hypothetical protein n=1 Tax=Rathayibacter toxicus TaxID=145458 RepID=UPI000CE7AAD7|nr:hypothetical protein [Rathayibacter toxicus]PPI55234.1 hypothetical protein C5D35_05825 [Rathayibacter toxicus]QOD09514.1 hypothetical protein BSG36_05845 [Rathayibacter toxicus]QWL28182.1 hypothetical protein E2R33_05850 [Rathayibacter toxicus]QWL32378.1 hypothetical protein E2R35_05720 [Rathayibacter toxicus]QWL34472.1 hypothetical protein E2R36_05725 [Rathayibacter toxicus]
MDCLLGGARLLGATRTTSVLVRDGYIAVVDDDPRVAPEVEVRDRDGRWLLPGLWDEHVHFSQWAMMAPRLDVSTAQSASEAARAVQERAAREGDVADTLIGYRFWSRDIQPG